MQNVELHNPPKAIRHFIWAWVLELNRSFVLCDLEQVTEHLWALVSIKIVTAPSSEAYCGNKIR